MKKGKKLLTIASAILGGGTIIAMICIMVKGKGLQEGLDFGAGAYYYADIPDFDKYLRWDAFKTSIPYWVYVVLFLVWGFLMYLLWIWVDKKHRD